MKNNEFTFEITEHIAILDIHPSGWRKELNMVSWNGQPPRYGIRDWDQTHERMNRGVTLTEKEMATIKDAVLNRDSLVKYMAREDRDRDEAR